MQPVAGTCRNLQQRSKKGGIKALASSARAEVCNGCHGSSVPEALRLRCSSLPPLPPADGPVHGGSSQFSEVKLMSCPAPTGGGGEAGNCGISSSVPARAHFLLQHLRRSARARPGPQSRPSLAPRPLGARPPNIYAKSTRPNCGIGLLAQFSSSPLTTALNYNPGQRA